MSEQDEMDLLMLAATLREAAVGKPGAGHVPLYHVTTPARLLHIMGGGFRDLAAKKGIPGIMVTHEFEPGVWIADVPPITVLPVDQFLAHEAEAWIEVFAPSDFYWNVMRGNEWQDETWPTRQWLVSSAEVNKLERRELPLWEVLALRLANRTTQHHRFQTEQQFEKEIDEILSGDEAARWRTALRQASTYLANYQLANFRAALRRRK